MFARFLRNISTGPWPDIVTYKAVLLLNDFMGWIATSLYNILSDSEYAYCLIRLLLSTEFKSHEKSIEPSAILGHPSV